MFICGAVYEYQYDGERNLYQENINVLKCVVQIYRHIYDPYVVNGKRGWSAGECFDTQPEQEDHLNVFMRGKVRNI